jgi:hypothetical protein
MCSSNAAVNKWIVQYTVEGLKTMTNRSLVGKISEPQLCIGPPGTGEHSIGEQRLPKNRVLAAGQSQAGTWTWLISNFRGGVVDAVWDVVKQ